MDREVTAPNREREVGAFSGWVMLVIDVVLVLGGLALFILSFTQSSAPDNEPVWAMFVPAILLWLAGFVVMFGLFTPFNGWVAVAIDIVWLLGGLGLFILSFTQSSAPDNEPVWAMFGSGILLWLVGFLMMLGFFTLEPNQARVLVLFGGYRGTVRRSGFWWTDPFYSNGPAAKGGSGASAAEGMMSSASAKKEAAASKPAKKFPRYKVSVRVRTLNGQKLKVNDKRGNPVEIAAVVVWRVADTAQAVFDVDDFEYYVETQSETSLRHLASLYAYDHGEENEITLRSNVEEVSEALKAELSGRLARAGVDVVEARLTHLAYAPEIAQAMLRRQQAEAVIDARQKIVHGAVSMVDMALRELSEKHVVELDDERKASMVSNLMVVLCAESEVHPVVNAGTLYN
jgi:regulator of protease activity HflC (stomatin/prohibitin superfamily)